MGYHSVSTTYGSGISDLFYARNDFLYSCLSYITHIIAMTSKLCGVGGGPELKNESVGSHSFMNDNVKQTFVFARLVEQDVSHAVAMRRIFPTLRKVARPYVA